MAKKKAAKKKTAKKTNARLEQLKLQAMQLAEEIIKESKKETIPVSVKRDIEARIKKLDYMNFETSFPKYGIKARVSVSCNDYGTSIMDISIEAIDKNSKINQLLSLLDMNKFDDLYGQEDLEHLIIKSKEYKAIEKEVENLGKEIEELTNKYNASFDW